MASMLTFPAFGSLILWILIVGFAFGNLGADWATLGGLSSLWRSLRAPDPRAELTAQERTNQSFCEAASPYQHPFLFWGLLSFNLATVALLILSAFGFRSLYRLDVPLVLLSLLPLFLIQYVFAQKIPFPENWQAVFEVYPDIRMQRYTALVDHWTTWIAASILTGLVAYLTSSSP